MEQSGRGPVRVWPILAVYGAVFLWLMLSGLVHLAVRLAQLDSQLSGPELTAAIQQIAQRPETLLFGIAVSAATTLFAGGAFLRWGLGTTDRPVWGLPRQGLGGPSFLGLATLVGLCLSQVASVLSLAASDLFPTSSLAAIEAGLSGASGATFFGIVFGLVCAAVGEELLFRGAMLPTLTRCWGPHRALWVSSGLFGLLHFDPLHSAFATVFGLYLGWLVQRTGSIAPALVVHAVNNLVAGLAPQTADAGAENSWLTGVSAALVGGIGLLFLRRTWRASGR